MNRVVAAIGLVIVSSMLIVDERIDAHKPITSKYTYTEDVYPIVRDRCGSCHAPGGIAPMSLLTYDDARPWAESMRAELTTGHMPPWYGDTGYAELKDPHQLSPRELDVLLTWITGGTPRGPAAPGQPAAEVKNAWRRGRPDLTLTLPMEITLPAGTNELTRDVVLQGAADADRFVSIADLRPGNPAIVHDALIYTRPPGGRGERTVLAAWIPGAAPIAPSGGAAFHWRAGDELAIRIHYRKTWMNESKPASDRSAVGLYLVKGTPKREIAAIVVPSADVALPDAVQPLAFRTEDAPSDMSVKVEARLPDGRRVPLVGLTTRAGWDQRYWLAQPRLLQKGTRLHVAATTPPPRPWKLWLEYASAGR
jgi:hypothetical protein